MDVSQVLEQLGRLLSAQLAIPREAQVALVLLVHMPFQLCMGGPNECAHLSIAYGVPAGLSFFGVMCHLEMQQQILGVRGDEVTLAAVVRQKMTGHVSLLPPSFLLFHQNFLLVECFLLFLQNFLVVESLHVQLQILCHPSTGWTRLLFFVFFIWKVCAVGHFFFHIRMFNFDVRQQVLGIRRYVGTRDAFIGQTLTGNVVLLYPLVFYLDVLRKTLYRHRLCTCWTRRLQFLQYIPINSVLVSLLFMNLKKMSL